MLEDIISVGVLQWWNDNQQQKTFYIWKKIFFELVCIKGDFAKYFAKCHNLFI